MRFEVVSAAFVNPQGTAWVLLVNQLVESNPGTSNNANSTSNFIELYWFLPNQHPPAPLIALWQNVSPCTVTKKAAAERPERLSKALPEPIGGLQAPLAATRGLRRATGGGVHPGGYPPPFS